MFTYIMLGTNDLPRSTRFYDAVMATLGHRRCDTTEEPGWENLAGWGTYENGGLKELALWVCAPFNGEPATAGNGTMAAFAASTRGQVNSFYEASMENGGTSEGAPGIREHYAPDFYVAYVRDPDGNKLAAVCRG
ncbi:MAG: VOC family protein [Pseudomonadota bacterium]